MQDLQIAQDIGVVKAQGVFIKAALRSGCKRNEKKGNC
jgi:hypothetical protein